MSTQLQTIGNFSVEEIEVMQQTLAVGTNPAQFGLFIRTAAAAGLNPFLNHIYCIVYNGKMSIQVSVEGIVYLAKRVEGYEGIDTQLVHENDEFEAHIDGDGKWVIGEHKIKFPRGKVLACYSIAYRTGFKPFTVFIEADEVQHHLSGTNSANWKKYYNDFFKKTTTKRAAKGQFGIEISEDEAPNGSGDGSDYQPAERKDVTSTVTETPKESIKPTTKPATKNTAPPIDITPEPTDEARLKEAQNTIADRFKQLGITKNKATWITENCNVFDVSNMTLEEYESCIKVMDMLIAEKAEQDDQPL